MATTTTWFYKDHPPTSGVRAGSGPHLAIYDERFNAHLLTSIVMI
jgi:hypothetical protein